MSEEIDVDRIAKLARLELSDEERASFPAQIGQILEHVKELESLDLDDVEATSHSHPVGNIYREDIATPEKCLGAEKTLQSAPRKSSDQFLVPKVM